MTSRRREREKKTETQTDELWLATFIFQFVKKLKNWHEWRYQPNALSDCRRRCWFIPFWRNWTRRPAGDRYCKTSFCVTTGGLVNYDKNMLLCDLNHGIWIWSLMNSPLRHRYVFTIPVQICTFETFRHRYLPFQFKFAPLRHRYVPHQFKFAHLRHRYVPYEFKFAPLRHRYVPATFNTNWLGLNSFT